MKIITKFLTLTLVALLSITATSKAQNYYDIGATDIPNIQNGDTLYIGTRIFVGYEFTNLGNNQFDSTINLKYTIQDSVYSPLNTLRLNLQIPSGNSVTNSDLSNLWEQLGVPILENGFPEKLQFGEYPEGQTQVCVIAESVGDTTKSNDTFCKKVYIKQPNWDIGISSFSNPDPEKDIDTTGGVQFGAYIRNYGSTRIPAGAGALTLRFKFGSGDWTSFPVNLGNNALPPGDSINFNLRNLRLADTGEFKVCMETLLAADPVQGNNKTCNNFHFVGDQSGGSGIANHPELQGLKSYPNPFVNQTRIQYTLNEESRVDMKIYNSQGQLVETVVSEHQKAGQHQFKFDRGDLQAGTYYYRLKTDEGVSTGKLMAK